jgi:heme/copper-type cytochrome/quinol oxidase subunit 3
MIATMQDNIKLGIALFMLSEVLFFIAFFWIFFHRSLSGIACGCGVSWPPVGIEITEPIAYPILNTTILLRRGCTATWAQCISKRGFCRGSVRSALVIIPLVSTYHPSLSLASIGAIN